MAIANALRDRVMDNRERRIDRRMDRREERREGRRDERRDERREGLVEAIVEPPKLFLWAAFGFMAASAVLQAAGRRENSLFVGQLAPALLLLGVYNKIVKGADYDEEAA